MEIKHNLSTDPATGIFFTTFFAISLVIILFIVNLPADFASLTINVSTNDLRQVFPKKPRLRHKFPREFSFPNANDDRQRPFADWRAIRKYAILYDSHDRPFININRWPLSRAAVSQCMETRASGTACLHATCQWLMTEKAGERVFPYLPTASSFARCFRTSQLRPRIVTSIDQWERSLTSPPSTLCRIADKNNCSVFVVNLKESDFSTLCDSTLFRFVRFYP